METKSAVDPASVGEDFAPSRFEDGRPMLLAGMRKSYDCNTRTQIPELWQEFAPKLSDLPLTRGFVTYGLIFGSGGDNFDYMAATEVSDVSNLPAGFTSVQIPAHKYAVFVHPGPTHTLPETIGSIFQRWLPTSGKEPALNPDFFERYGEQFNPETLSGDLEIWLPIK